MSKSLGSNKACKKKGKEPATKAQQSITSFFINKSDNKLQTIETSLSKTITNKFAASSHIQKENCSAAVKIDNHLNGDDSLQQNGNKNTTRIRKRKLSPTSSKFNKPATSNENKINATLNILDRSVTVLSQSKKHKENTKSACQMSQNSTENAINVLLQPNIAKCKLSNIKKPSGVTISTKPHAQNILPTELVQKNIKTPEKNITPKSTKLDKYPQPPSPIDTSSSQIRIHKIKEIVKESILNINEVKDENYKIDSSKQHCEITRRESFSDVLDDKWDDILLNSGGDNSPLRKDRKFEESLRSPNKFADTSSSTPKTPQKGLAGLVLRRSPRNHKLSQPAVATDINKIEYPKQSLNFVQEESHKDLPSEKVTQKLEDFSNMFKDDWDDDFLCGSAECMTLQDLNLQIWQRCEIIDMVRDPKTFNITLNVKEAQGESWATCRLEGIWRDCTLNVGDIVCILCMKDDHDAWVIGNSGGLLVQWPDTLLSGTTIAGSVFCKRKVVLQERFKGIDCNNKIMTIGSLVHELLQIALKKRLSTVSEVISASRNLLQDLNCLYMLYGSDMSEEEATIEIAKFVPQIVTFIDNYMVDRKRDLSSKHTTKKKKSDEWLGEIHSILDIEENIWSPRLGVKGKIDVTVEVLLHSKDKETKIMPLELKTGKASMSAEHRGQVLLYTMMMSLKEQARDASAEHLTQGLLLYLKDTVTVKEISSGYPEKRDLVKLRNELAYYLARKPTVNYPGQLATSRADSGIVPDDNHKMSYDLVPMDLPAPINHYSACGNCPYLTLCSLYLERYSPGSISENHPLSKLKLQALGHLEQKHVEYFIHWTGLLVLENMKKASHTPLEDIWLKKPEEREKRGKCLSHMTVSGEVAECDKRYIHTFEKHLNKPGNIEDIRHSLLRVGEYLVVSTDIDIAVATGTVSSIDKTVIRISLDRNLLNRNMRDMQYHLDLYESQSMMSFNLTNLAVLMDDLDHSHKLRKMIINKDRPSFNEKMPRSVATLGKHILSRLNLVQQRAVLKALTADQYLLIKGMPGTGKTQTVAALIELLVAMDKSVLVTSHTHSAVDNVLLRLPDTVRVMRLGSSNRVQADLLLLTEECLTAHCNTPDELAEVYNSVKVVGVTCLGAGHPMLTKRKFDVCLVDESTQVLQSTVLRPLFAAKKIVLIGDPDQLPPIVRSNTARHLGLDESLFARLDGLGGTISLTLQYRMNAVITRLANRLTYAGQLQCANQSVEQACLQMSNYKVVRAEYKEENSWILECLSPFIQNSVILLDTGNTFTEMCQTNMENQSINQNSVDCRDKLKPRGCTNVIETAIVLALVEALLNAGIESQNIGVIAPYRDQVEQLQKCVSNLTLARKANTMALNVEVNTVDQYQGRDKEVIIYSCTKTWNQHKGEFIVKDTEILEDKRRLTVAITRAKHKLIMIGDVATLQHYSTFSKLLECLRHEERDAFVSLREVDCSLEGLFKHFKSYFNN